MGDKQTLRFAIAAAVAGLAWGYINHRRDPRAPAYAVLQALEWFVAYGGAAVLIEFVRQGLDEDDDDLEITERVMRTKQTVTDETRGLGD